MWRLNLVLPPHLSSQALGLTSLGIGIWFVVQADNFGEALTGSGFVSAGALFIIVGGVTFIVAALGCLGAACKLRSLLLIVSQAPVAL